MRRAYSNREIRAAEERAIGRGEMVSSLMERAGLALADAVEAAMCQCGADGAIFVCGGGNNGGDGFVAARLLMERGRDVAVLCMAERFSEACAAAKARYHGECLGRIPRRRYAVAVDCLFGTGLTRPIDGVNEGLVAFLNGADHVIACDVPSGLSESGIALGAAVRAEKTVSMGALKQALLLADGADLSGEIVVADLGLPLEGGAEVWEEGDVSQTFPKKKSHSNKGSYGSVAILAGQGRLGASLLSAGAALKSGAGYTELWLPSSAAAGMDAAQIAAARAADQVLCAMVTAKYPACIVGLYDGEPFFSEALAYGMGAGVGPACRRTLAELLSAYTGTLVLDADTLNTLAVCGTEMLLQRQCPVIVTPHIKEFSRLTGKTVEEILSDPVGHAEAFAKDYSVTVVLKNNRTVITDGRRTAINCTGSPALAKGGSGDVLSGFLAGICARGVPPFEAACAACYLCGRAGERMAARMGEYAPDASDLIGFLPEAMRTLIEAN